MTDTGERNEKLVRSWLLALLRFAVTLDNNDRLAVHAIATEIDGRDKRSTGFSFFRKTSVELCNAIASPQLAASPAILQRHLDRMGSGRLKQAFVATVGPCRPQPGSKLKPVGPDGQHDLWKGLPARSRSPRHAVVPAKS
ncbi:MAG: hypothetical protein G4V63_14680 [Candidatus Afipia apatlaquensis]|uniref:Uncharacterized protein n=1 Tax=Candidatus Afipia apatlaquensis TaxID=2712852 RepID=A0A7C9VLM4_9BRAD|nr:hypothetical protein [Candidatus Afipia apatlaquensis]